MRRWLKQPHLDITAIHPFFGSILNYLLLMMCYMLVLFCALCLIRDSIQLLNSHVVQAQVEMVKHPTTHQPQVQLRFVDVSAQVRYFNLSTDVVAQAEQSPADDLLEISIHYVMLPNGDVELLYPENALSKLWLMGLQGVLILALLYACWFLSPYPAWYWKHAMPYFQSLSANALKIEVRLQSFQDVEICPHTSNRICQLHTRIFIPSVQRYMVFQSPKVLVEPAFYMSYPFVVIYINLKDLNDYDVDLMHFLKHNASTLHGYTDQDRCYPLLTETWMNAS
jgi:hypothetical protein